MLVQRAIHPGYGKWALPGGFVEPEEAPDDAARREASEEANVEVSIENLIGVYRAGAESDVIVVVYGGEVVSGTPSPGDEALRIGLFPPQGLPWEDLAFPATRAALSDYVAGAGLTA
ncbi:MAG: NUDIX domain-containing protein [Actinomycetota bacterium]|nr:NUDIX domain-containing protein [Actinomycetota bacterium]